MSSYEIDNRLKQHDEQIAQLMNAMAAIIERFEMLEGRNNAVVEGDDIQPKATRNGKLRHK